MQREVEIRVFDNSNNHIGSLDLEEATDFPLKLTKRISDIRDISKRGLNFSLDFEIPKTANNNRVLAGMKNINTTSTEKQILEKKRCRIYVNGNEEDRGFVKFHTTELLSFYTATFFGGNTDWVELQKDIDLNELDWSNLNEPSAGEELFDGTRIDVINNGTSTDYDITYPAVDRNNGSEASSLRPQIYMNKFFQRAFEKIGYSINTGGFLDSTFVKGDGGDYKGLTLDPAAQFLVDETDIESTRAEYTTSRITQGEDPNSWNNTYVLSNQTTPRAATTPVVLSKLSNFWDTLIKDDIATYNPANGEYTVQSTAYHKITLNAPNKTYAYAYNIGDNWTQWVQNVNPQVKHPPSTRYIFVKNNVSSTVIDGEIIGDTYPGVLTQAKTNAANQNFTIFAEASAFLRTGDKITVWTEIKDNAFGINAQLNAPSLEKWKITLGAGTTVNFQKAEQIRLGDQYDINAVIPDGIKVLDLIKDYTIKYNLYYTPDFVNNKITIKTRDNFYQNIGNADNITSLIDMSSPIEIDYNMGYKRDLKFTFNQDSTDGYLEQWQKLNKRTYGEYTHTFSDRFDPGETILSTSVLSATLQTVMDGDIVTSIINEEWLDSENQGKGLNANYAPRTFQVIRNQQFDLAGNPRRTQSPLIISCALMEEFGNVSTINDKKLTFNGENGLVDQFYGRTIANIEDGAIVTLKMNMSLTKFENIDLSRPVYIDIEGDIKGYYVYQSINQFDIVEPGLTEVELLRYREYDPITIDPTQKTNINENTTEGINNTQPKAIWFVYDEDNPPATYEQVYEDDGQGN
jgi:hypothetical protein